MFILQVTRVLGWAGVGLVGGVYITSDEGVKLGWSGTCRWCLYYKCRGCQAGLEWDL